VAALEAPEEELKGVLEAASEAEDEEAGVEVPDEEAETAADEPAAAADEPAADDPEAAQSVVVPC
jgi:hypothetical protein